MNCITLYGFCNPGNILEDVLDSRLNKMHFTVDLSIPWGADERDAAATIYSLIVLPKPTANNTIEILSISQWAKALIFDWDAIHTVNDPSTCSRNGNSVFCQKMPKMLLNHR